jgi:hypothetical protein
MGQADQISNFWLGVTSSVVAAALLWVAGLSWNWASSAAKGTVSRRITRNRRNLTIILLFTLLVTLSGAIVAMGDRLSKFGVLYLAGVCIVALVWHLVTELNAFWKIGFNYVEQSISRTTYTDALSETYSEFLMLGTNAYSITRLEHLEQMMRRVRENRGEVRMVFAHPDSPGLQEAARNRNKRQDLYRDQAMFSLGYLLSLSSRLGLPVEIRLYQATGLEELPIFRIMLLNAHLAVASIAVYGRADHGRNMPQLYAYRISDASKSHRSMYSVLCRYYKYFYDKSALVTPAEAERFLRCWGRLKSRGDLVSFLEG